VLKIPLIPASGRALAARLHTVSYHSFTERR
jgi:hypothetical protein